MGWMKCSVPGCEDRTSPRHRFPIFDQQVYDEWLARIGNDQLPRLHPLAVYYGRRVCGRHFSHHCKLPNSIKLKQRSLPTVDLPFFNEAPTLDNSILRLNKQFNDRKSSQASPERNLNFQRIFDEIAKDCHSDTSPPRESVDHSDLTMLFNLDYTHLVNDGSCVPNDGAISAALSSFDVTLLSAEFEGAPPSRHAVP